MSTWDDTKAVGTGPGLLPTGVRTYRIDAAHSEVGNNGKRQVTVTLSDSEGNTGSTSVLLEPFANNPDAIEQWERLMKTAAVGLGFTPSRGDLPMRDIAQEFGDWVDASGLVGCDVEALVKHADAKPKEDGSHLKHDGTPFKNHRVTFRSIVNGDPSHGGFAAAAAVPSFAGAAAGDPWG